MLTTEGATCLAIWVNWEGNSTAFGIVSGVASGAKLPVLGRAAFTPVLISVPITTPIASVNTIRVNESSFSFVTCRRISWDILLLRYTPPGLKTHRTAGHSN